MLIQPCSNWLTGVAVDALIELVREDQPDSAVAGAERLQPSQVLDAAILGYSGRGSRARPIPASNGRAGSVAKR